MKGFLSRFLLGFFTGVGLITFIVVILLGISYVYIFGPEKSLPKKIVVRQMKKFDKDVGILSANLEILPNLIFT